ncbi:MAG: 3-hydroxyacyl-CoA dehydrogenase family protein [Flavisolibacter sp.]
MQILVLADEGQKKELLAQGTLPGTEVFWLQDPGMMHQYSDASACIDLLFTPTEDRIELLKKLSPRIILVNSVAHTLSESDSRFIRINGWNSFLASGLIEASALPAHRENGEKVLQQFNKKIEWLPDIPGFVTPRVVSMIINEAYLSLEENISTKEEINTAMKLGTNYPYGPFEWAEKIGPVRVRQLLEKLSASSSRYQPSQLLK